jgi:hypothetical protein
MCSHSCKGRFGDFFMLVHGVNGDVIVFLRSFTE